MSATARLLGWCVAFGLTLSVSSVSAGPNVMVGGTHVGWIALGQTDQSDSAASRREAEKWLKQAREAMKNGDLDIAEYCIERAEKVSVEARIAACHVQGHAGQGAQGSGGAACRAGEAQRPTAGPLSKLFHKDKQRQRHTPPSDPYLASAGPAERPVDPRTRCTQAVRWPTPA